MNGIPTTDGWIEIVGWAGGGGCDAAAVVGGALEVGAFEAGGGVEVGGASVEGGG